MRGRHRNSNARSGRSARYAEPHALELVTRSLNLNANVAVHAARDTNPETRLNFRGIRQLAPAP